MQVESLGASDDSLHLRWCTGATMGSVLRSHLADASTWRWSAASAGRLTAYICIVKVRWKTRLPVFHIAIKELAESQAVVTNSRPSPRLKPQKGRRRRTCFLKGVITCNITYLQMALKYETNLSTKPFPSALLSGLGCATTLCDVTFQTRPPGGSTS